MKRNQNTRCYDDASTTGSARRSEAVDVVSQEHLSVENENVATWMSIKKVSCLPTRTAALLSVSLPPPLSLTFLPSPSSTVSTCQPLSGTRTALVFMLRGRSPWGSHLLFPPSPLSLMHRVSQRDDVKLEGGGRTGGMNCRY